MDHAMTRRALSAAGLVLVLAASAPAFAQQPPAQPPAQPPVRVRGTIEKVDGAVLTVKSRAGETLTIKLADNARVLGMAGDARRHQARAYGHPGCRRPTVNALHLHFFRKPCVAWPRGWPVGRAARQHHDQRDGRRSDCGARRADALVKYKVKRRRSVPANTPIVNTCPATRPI
jgi:hypothetical protein